MGSAPPEPRNSGLNADQRAFCTCIPGCSPCSAPRQRSGSSSRCRQISRWPARCPPSRCRSGGSSMHAGSTSRGRATFEVTFTSAFQTVAHELHEHIVGPAGPEAHQFAVALAGYRKPDNSTLRRARAVIAHRLQSRLIAVLSHPHRRAPPRRNLFHSATIALISKGVACANACKAAVVVLPRRYSVFEPFHHKLLRIQHGAKAAPLLVMESQQAHDPGRGTKSPLPLPGPRQIRSRRHLVIRPGRACSIAHSPRGIFRRGATRQARSSPPKRK